VTDAVVARAIARPRIVAPYADPELTEALAAERRCARMPCVCGASQDGGELLSLDRRGDDVFELVRCGSCGKTFRRTWIGGYT
jgi:hypothetical protein